MVFKFEGRLNHQTIRPIQLFQSITLRIIIVAPWYITNQALHNE